MLQWILLVVTCVALLLIIIVSAQLVNYEYFPKRYNIEKYVFPDKYRTNRITFSQKNDYIQVQSGDQMVRLGPNETIFSSLWGLKFVNNPRFSFEDLLRRKIPKINNKFCAIFNTCDRSHPFVEILETISGKSIDILDCPEKFFSKVLFQLKSDALRDYEQYTYLICVEDKIADNYITEKLVFPLLLPGVIPIYLGAPNVGSYFNTKAFVNVSDFQSLEECARFVTYMYHNTALLTECQMQPNLSREQLEAQIPWYFWTRGFREPFFKALNLKIPEPYVSVSGWKSAGADYIIINLDSHTKRWNKVKARFDKLSSATYERFPAINGKRLAPAFESKIDWKRGSGYYDGEIGVYLSNMDIYYSLINEPPEVDFYAILEDDIVSDDIKSPRDLVASAPPDWDIIFLGVHKIHCLKKGPLGDFQRVYPNCMPGAFSYIVRKRMAQYFVNFFDPIEGPIDQLLQFLARDFTFYMVVPDVFTPDYRIATSVRS